MSYRWEFSLAGVRHHDVPYLGCNGGLGRQLALRRKVWLERDSRNTHDPNAIAVKARCNNPGRNLMLGFVPMETSPRVAPLLDAATTRVVGTVTGLHEDVREGSSRANWEVTVTCFVPDSWQDAVCWRTKRKIEYYVYRGVSTPYVLLNCSDEQFREIIASMADHGIRYTGQGRSWLEDLPTPYAWYIHLESGLESCEETVEGFFRDVYGLESERERAESRRRQDAEYRQTLDELRKKGEEAKSNDEVASSFAGMYDQARRQNNEQNAEIAHLQDRLSAKEYRINQLEEQVAHERRAKESAVTPEVGAALRDVIGPELEPPTSLELIARVFRDRVEVSGIARESAEHIRSLRGRGELFGLLWKLADEYWARRDSGEAEGTAMRVFPPKCYAARESDSVEQDPALRKSRTFLCKGKPTFMPAHLKAGDLRVHFIWLAGDHKIAIGYCGKHLPEA